MTGQVIERIEIEGLLAKLNGTFVGGLRDDKSTVSLIKYGDWEFNVSIEHPSFNFGNGKKAYIFPRVVCERSARESYDLFRRLK